MEYLKDFDEVQFRRNLDRSMYMLEELEEVVVETIISEREGTYAPYSFVSLMTDVDQEVVEEAFDSEEIYLKVDDIMEGMNEELEVILEDTKIQSEYPHARFNVQWYDGAIALVAYTVS